MCNDKTLLQVCFLQRLSLAFEVNKGMRQGYALSPTLLDSERQQRLNIGLEKVIRESHEGRRIEVIGKETVIAYADSSFTKYTRGSCSLIF